MRAVVFDFDGTITYGSKNIWNMTWERLGFDIGEGSIYKLYHERFKSGVWSYEKWCQETAKLFAERDLRIDLIDACASETKVIEGFSQVVEQLSSQGIKLFILSGSVRECIERVIGDDGKYFTGITANSFKFDESGKFVSMTPSRYDYKGKAEYISMIEKFYKIPASEITFVGNGSNDEWVYLSGCRTICINPDGAHFENKKIWNEVIEKSDDFRDLLPILEDANNKGESQINITLE